MSTLLSPNQTFVFPSFKLSPIDALESVVKYKCNLLVAFPKIALNILDLNRERKLDISRLVMMFCGGQNESAELIDRIKHETNCWMFGSGYGMTELGSLSGFKYSLRSYKQKHYKGCIGQPSPFTECKIVDPETGQIQPLNTKGELHVRGYNVTRGYWNDPEITSKSLDSEGWLVYFFSKKSKIFIAGIHILF